MSTFRQASYHMITWDYLFRVTREIQSNIPERQGDDTMWVLIKQTCALIHSASMLLHVVLYTVCPSSSTFTLSHQQHSAFICTLYLPSCLSAPWQVYHLFSCCDSTILMSVTSTGQAGPHAHSEQTQTHIQSHTGTGNHITHAGIHAHTQTLFVRGDSRPLKGRAVTPHHEPNEAKVARRGGREEERLRDGWSGTTEQYGGGWVELYAREATGARRQISGAWNRLWETLRDRQRGREKVR